MKLASFVAEAKNELKNNLSAIVLYGSRYWGYFTEASDYDVFILLGKRDQKSILIKEKLQAKYPQVSIMYFIDKNDILEKSKTGSWAAYAVLLNGSRPIYKTDAYDQLLMELRSIKPSKRMIALDYRNNKNELEQKALLERSGFEANKWAFLSIWKRMQIVDYFQQELVDMKYEKNIENSRDYLKPSEVSFIKELRDRTYDRSEEWNGEDCNNALAIMKKINRLIEMGA